MEPIHSNKTNIDLSESVSQALLYSDIFSYPLLPVDVLNALNHNGTSIDEVCGKLFHLKDLGIIEESEGYFGIGDIKEKVKRRKEGNQRAEAIIPKAKKWSRFISGFPFVRAVFISGSLSKSFMDADGDVDYFIVTKPERLWIARTFLVFFKKLFLFNSHKYFCVNYFVDTDHLEIEEKNLFTATEIVTLMPICGAELYQKFYAANNWTNAYYPNVQEGKQASFSKAKNGFLKSCVELLLGGKLGKRLDTYFMNLTMKHWQKKFHDFDPSRFEHALKSRRYVSKHHPNDYQKKVLDAFQIKKAAFIANLRKAEGSI